MTVALAQEWQLSLMGSWLLQRGSTTMKVAIREQRLIACVALLGCRRRSFLSGLLWPKSNEKQAAGNLRTSVWCITHSFPNLLQTTPVTLELHESVQVDVSALRQHLQTLHEDPGLLAPDSYLDHLGRADLLPGWYDDWVLFEQERLRQLRLDALEEVGRRYLAANDTGRAVLAALTAVSIEPLRESAQFLLIQAHMAAGNRAAAVRAYTTFANRLDEELGVQPSDKLADLMSTFHPRRECPGTFSAGR